MSGTSSYFGQASDRGGITKRATPLPARAGKTTAETVLVSNALRRGCERRGWFLGHFFPEATAEVEMKWGLHPAGDERRKWAVNDTATSVSILLKGRFCVEFADREVWLEREGDFVQWSPGVPHRWRAAAESTIMTARWPSVPNDSRDVEDPRLP